MMKIKDDGWPYAVAGFIFWCLVFGVIIWTS